MNVTPYSVAASELASSLSAAIVELESAPPHEAPDLADAIALEIEAALDETDREDEPIPPARA